MTRYYFNLDDENNIADDEGEPCETLDEARAHAYRVASELAAHKPDAHATRGCIRVTDAKGKEVFRTPLGGRDASKNGR
jgi:hypothetical protein